MMKISPEICHNYHKSKLTTTRFYCFINDKIKNEPENLELDINVAKTGNSAFFRGKRRIPRRQRENSRAARNTAGPGNQYRLVSVL